MDDQVKQDSEAENTSGEAGQDLLHSTVVESGLRPTVELSADRTCANCGKAIYQSENPNDIKWYHREDGCVPCVRPPLTFATPLPDGVESSLQHKHSKVARRAAEKIFRIVKDKFDYAGTAKDCENTTASLAAIIIAELEKVEV